MYAYAGNNPVRYIDPDGRKAGYFFVKIEGFYDSSKNIHIDSFNVVYGNNATAVQKEFIKILTSGDRQKTSPLPNSDSIVQKNSGFTKIIIITKVTAYEIEDNPEKFNPTTEVQSTEKFEFPNISLDDAINSINIFLNNDDGKPKGALNE